MNLKTLVLFSILCHAAATTAWGQNSADHFHDAEGNTYHQLFLDFHVDRLIDIRYATDEQPVDGKLSADGYSVIIKNYTADKSVKLKVTTDAGAEKEITKSRCFIDPVFMEL